MTKPPAKPTAPAGPLAALEGLRASLPAGAAPAAPPTAATAAPVAPRGPARAVVRMERKGRGGKEVTIVDKLGLPAAELERWCRELKHALGCGGTVDGDAIVLQGDLRKRIAAVLEQHGVGRVTIG